jgi:beta-xylosidase
MVTTRPKRGHANPIYSGYFADPFVWKSGGSYYAIGTGEEEANGCTEEADHVLPLLRSSDFYHWEFIGKALARPDATLGRNFWAPAVAPSEGKFYLYYSVGHGDKQHQLRVALADSPEGPYRDVGQPLINPDECPFAIDPHPFQDDDGRWYMFFARDFLDASGATRAGTALVAAAMKSMTELDREPFEVLRAHADWQRFESDRMMYGRKWDWHTLEGPCVCKHDGRYYCFYSGGRWEDETYGVDYGIAEAITGPYSDSGNESGPRVLQTLAGRLRGPGHNTIIAGPDEDTEYMVYHAWDTQMKKRQMYVSELLWTPEGPRVVPG